MPISSWSLRWPSGSAWWPLPLAAVHSTAASCPTLSDRFLADLARLRPPPHQSINHLFMSIPCGAAPAPPFCTTYSRCFYRDPSEPPTASLSLLCTVPTALPITRSARPSPCHPTHKLRPASEPARPPTPLVLPQHRRPYSRFSPLLRHLPTCTYHCGPRLRSPHVCVVPTAI